MLEPGFLERQVVGVSSEACAIRGLVCTAAASTQPVMLLGEPGTGKQLIAQLIHEYSPRAMAPFLMIDCSLYYERELKRELFGYGDGPDSGCGSSKGILEFASRGTCYLSHVEELSPSIQDALSGFLRAKRFCRLGDQRQVTSGARLIVSSDKNLQGFVRAGLFDRGLFESLAGILRRLSPLRNRKEDIPLVVGALQDTMPDKKPSEFKIDFASETLEAMQCYPWPHNFDELKKEVGRLLQSGRAHVVPEHLSMEISSYWLGQQGDPEVRKVLEELDGYIREFRIMSRLSCELGDVTDLFHFNGESQRDCHWDLMEEF